MDELQELVNVIPASGDMDFDAWKQQLVANNIPLGNGRFNNLRASGRIVLTIDGDTLRIARGPQEA